MSLKYWLVDNHLTKDPTDFMAKIMASESITHEQLVQLIMLKNVGVAESSILSVLHEYSQAARYMAQQGKSIITPMFNITPSISGVFVDEEDKFDPSRHKVKLNVTLGLSLRDVVKEIKTEKVDGVQRLPVLKTLVDLGSSTRNEKLSPGSPAKIHGKLLKFDDTVAEQGIYLIAENNSETKVTLMVQNYPGELVFQIPAGLAKGAYKVAVRSTMGGSELREGRLKNALAVA